MTTDEIMKAAHEESVRPWKAWSDANGDACEDAKRTWDDLVELATGERPDAKRDAGEGKTQWQRDEENWTAWMAGLSCYPSNSESWHASAQATRRRCKEAVEALKEKYLGPHKCDIDGQENYLRAIDALLESEFAEGDAK